VTFSARVDVKSFRQFAGDLIQAQALIGPSLALELGDQADEIGQAMIREGASKMPRRGGLSATVAGSRAQVSRKVTWDGAEVEVGLAGPVDLGTLDSGVVHHPVFGNRGVWVTQGVPSGAFTGAANRSMDKVEDGAARAVHRVIRAATH